MNSTSWIRGLVTVAWWWQSIEATTYLRPWPGIPRVGKPGFHWSPWVETIDQLELEWSSELGLRSSEATLKVPEDMFANASRYKSGQTAARRLWWGRLHAWLAEQPDRSVCLVMGSSPEMRMDRQRSSIGLGPAGGVADAVHYLLATLRSNWDPYVAPLGHAVTGIVVPQSEWDLGHGSDNHANLARLVSSWKRHPHRPRLVWWLDDVADRFDGALVSSQPHWSDWWNSGDPDTHTNARRAVGSAWISGETAYPPVLAVDWFHGSADGSRSREFMRDRQAWACSMADTLDIDLWALSTPTNFRRASWASSALAEAWRPDPDGSVCAWSHLSRPPPALVGRGPLDLGVPQWVLAAHVPQLDAAVLHRKGDMWASVQWTLNAPRLGTEAGLCQADEWQAWVRLDPRWPGGWSGPMDYCQRDRIFTRDEATSKPPPYSSSSWTPWSNNRLNLPAVLAGPRLAVGINPDHLPATSRLPSYHPHTNTSLPVWGVVTAAWGDTTPVWPPRLSWFEWKQWPVSSAHTNTTGPCRATWSGDVLVPPRAVLRTRIVNPARSRPGGCNTVDDAVTWSSTWPPVPPSEHDPHEWLSPSRLQIRNRPYPLASPVHLPADTWMLQVLWVHRPTMRWSTESHPKRVCLP
jgi:hypothetical protein